MQVQEGSAKNCLLSLTLDFTKKAGIYQSVLLISAQAVWSNTPHPTPTPGQSQRTANNQQEPNI